MSLYPLPSLFQDRLDEQPPLRAALDLTLENFGAWLHDSRLPFFEDYTDHGPRHIREVLATSADLMTQEARAIFSAQDAAVYILAALLHDAAMHLSPAGFEALIRGDSAHQRVEGFDGEAQLWPKLWNEYIYSVKHWNDTTLINIFGEKAASLLHGTVPDPFSRYYDLRDTDRKLIGEFIRRHHPRMAHEFALYGVPGPSGKRLHLFAEEGGFSPDLRDLAGLVARSHGLPVRDCMGYLARKDYARWQPKVHAVFLMALLRLADYIQIQPGRAISPRFDFKNIDSPLSRLEHRVHQAVWQAFISEDDEPEVLRIMAKPADVHVYLRLKEWIAGIQAELDAAWAVLGEAYGLKPNLKNLGFNLRRVRSNLGSVVELAEIVDFEPRRVEMSVARAELLKLLIRPLYGDKPEIGIRELMQNAVDAVRELQTLQETDPRLADLPWIEQEGDVEIWLDEPDESGFAWLTVSARGVGMTADVICDYFLRLGASYRQSETWQQQYERETAQGVKSRVLRSGRFGIGVLAAFLLGEEIEVATRHFSASHHGLRFSTRLDGGPIELKHDPRLPYGTTIRIRIKREVYDKLAPQYRLEGWDWYCLQCPRVVRYLGQEKRRLQQSVYVPGLDEPLPPGWYAVPAPGFAAIHLDMNRSQRDWLVCNGIRVLSGTIYKWFDYYRADLLFILTTPLISVFDPDAVLPLNLQRDEIEGQWLPFRQEGYDLLARTLLADLLRLAPENPFDYSSLDSLWHRLYCSTFYELRPWLHAREGVTLVEPWFLLNAGLRSFVVFDADREASVACLEAALAANAYDGVIPLSQHGGSRMDARNFLDGFQMINGRGWNQLSMAGARLLTTSESAYYLVRGREGIATEWTNGTWTMLVWGECPATNIDTAALTTLSLPPFGDREPALEIAEWFLSPEQPAVQPTGLAAYWKALIDHPVIPYNLKDRESDLEHAYEALRAYMRPTDARVPAS
jgi:molecular chaperone HtpG